MLDIVHDLIAWKRDGHELDDDRMDAFVRGVLDGTVASYQASALLMAMVVRGLTERETVALARAMVHNGKVMDLSAVGRPVLDKHSSGGVGDSVTLVLAPLVAACGGVFGKMSGRGLGHTGGTLDKLASIPGFRLQLSHGEFVRQLERVGVAVIGQSERIVPADKTLYALRDVTATVDEPGLIAASIMAKKMASGTSAVALDIKVGSGAFMTDLDAARTLAGRCLAVGTAFGRSVTALFTAMDQPLGHAVGNRLEVEEAWQVLQGGGPADLRTVTLELAAVVLALSDLHIDEQEARKRAAAALDDGRAAERFESWVAAQGGRWQPGAFQRLAGAEVRSPAAGFVSRCDARAVGRAAQLAGAGRQHADDEVDASAGVLLARKLGEPVDAGDVLATVHARDPQRREAAQDVLQAAYSVAERPPDVGSSILGRYAAGSPCG